VAPAIELKKVFTRNEALNDFSVLKASGSQKFLAERYGVSEATKWLSHWAESGAINRPRTGKTKRTVLALPSPKAKARPLALQPRGKQHVSEIVD
jgi:hypothetical protein